MQTPYVPPKVFKGGREPRARLKVEPSSDGLRLSRALRRGDSTTAVASPTRASWQLPHLVGLHLYAPLLTVFFESFFFHRDCIRTYQQVREHIRPGARSRRRDPTLVLIGHRDLASKSQHPFLSVTVTRSVPQAFAPSLVRCKLQRESMPQIDKEKTARKDFRRPLDTPQHTFSHIHVLPPFKDIDFVAHLHAGIDAM